MSCRPFPFTSASIPDHLLRLRQALSQSRDTVALLAYANGSGDGLFIPEDKTYDKPNPTTKLVEIASHAGLIDPPLIERFWQDDTSSLVWSGLFFNQQSISPEGLSTLRQLFLSSLKSPYKTAYLKDVVQILKAQNLLSPRSPDLLPYIDHLVAHITEPNYAERLVIFLSDQELPLSNFNDCLAALTPSKDKSTTKNTIASNILNDLYMAALSRPGLDPSQAFYILSLVKPHLRAKLYLQVIHTPSFMQDPRFPNAIRNYLVSNPKNKDRPSLLAGLLPCLKPSSLSNDATNLIPDPEDLPKYLPLLTAEQINAIPRPVLAKWMLHPSQSVRLSLLTHLARAKVPAPSPATIY